MRLVLMVAVVSLATASTAVLADNEGRQPGGTYLAQSTTAKGYPTGKTGSSSPGAAGTPVAPSTGVPKPGTTDPATPIR